ncbi:MAG TPA: sulfite exporter TauE/SafE family protein [Rudaea sp.]|jgi:uncharacterized membrane protein YfcA
MVVFALLALLTVLGLLYFVDLLIVAGQRRQLRPNAESVALGAVANFFDTLGIGSFAPTTAWLKLRKLIPDSYLPATLNSGHALPTIAQALIFVNLVRVDAVLLASCIAAAIVGALIGAPLVMRLPVRAVRGVVGIALLVAAVLYALANLGKLPAGGDALTLAQPLFVTAIVVHFVLGALMTFGIGLYAPSLILLSLFGLNPIAAFPIMMGACAFLMPISGMRFVRSDRVDLRVVLGLAIGGIPAVLLAAYVVKSMPLTVLRWGVVIVVVYAAVLLLRAAVKPSESPAVAAGNEVAGES